MKKQYNVMFMKDIPTLQKKSVQHIIKNIEKEIQKYFHDNNFLLIVTKYSYYDSLSIRLELLDEVEHVLLHNLDKFL